MFQSLPMETKKISQIFEDIYFWILKNKNNLKIFLMAVAIITGSTGLVGSEAVNLFCDKGFDVIGIDNNLRKFFGSLASQFKLKKKF